MKKGIINPFIDCAWLFYPYGCVHTWSVLVRIKWTLVQLLKLKQYIVQLNKKQRANVNL